MKMIDHNHFICHLILGTFTEYPSEKQKIQPEKHRNLPVGFSIFQDIGVLLQCTSFCLLNHLLASIHIYFHTTVFLTSGFCTVVCHWIVFSHTFHTLDL